jgi:hypothetical protein
VDFTGTPFSRALSGGGGLDQDRALLDVSGDYRLTGRIAVFGRLRWVELEQRGSSVLETVAQSRWNIDATRLEAGLELAAPRGLSMALGWAGERRDTDYRQADARFDDAAAVETSLDGVFLRLGYRPSRRLTVNLTVEDDSLDDPFTLASPTDSRRYRLRAGYRWDNGLNASAVYRYTERQNDNSGWSADQEQVDLRLGYASGALTLSAGLSRIDLSRTVDTLVIGGSRQALFAIDYDAEADFADLAVTWRLGPSLSAGGSFRWYDNGGSFAVARDDARLFVEGLVGEGYQWHLAYRTVDFSEGGIESFDADVFEVAVGMRW